MTTMQLEPQFPEMLEKTKLHRVMLKSHSNSWLSDLVKSNPEYSSSFHLQFQVRPRNYQGHSTHLWWANASRQVRRVGLLYNYREHHRSSNYSLILLSQDPFQSNYTRKNMDLRTIHHCQIYKYMPSSRPSRFDCQSLQFYKHGHHGYL